MEKYIIGIDEVGRGPIAGPVAVCAFLCKEGDVDQIIQESGLPIRDSKKLTKIQRGKWYKYLRNCQKEGKCDFAVNYVTAENIDKFGISKCIQKALNSSLAKLDVQNFLRVGAPGERVKRGNFAHPVLINQIYVYLDGGLKAPKEYVNQQTVIKGDELYPIISLASIVAKVSRDNVMQNFAKEYPEYGFENHAGYGTKAHYEAIKKHGTTSLHRKTFINL